jgi:hypothetical protein
MAAKAGSGPTTIYMLAHGFVCAGAYAGALAAAAAARASVCFVALALGGALPPAAAAAAAAGLVSFSAGLDPWDDALLSVAPCEPAALAHVAGAALRGLAGSDPAPVRLVLPVGGVGGGATGSVSAAAGGNHLPAGPTRSLRLLAQTEVLELDGALARRAACPCHGLPVAAAGACADWPAGLCGATGAAVRLDACDASSRFILAGGLPLQPSARASRSALAGVSVLPPCELGPPRVPCVALTALRAIPLADVSDALLFGNPVLLVANDAGDGDEAGVGALVEALRERCAGLVAVARADLATSTARSLPAHYLLRPAAGVAVLLARRLAAGDERLPLTLEAVDGGVAAGDARAAGASLDALSDPSAPAIDRLSAGVLGALEALAPLCVAPTAAAPPLPPADGGDGDGDPAPAPSRAAAKRGRGGGKGVLTIHTNMSW